MVVLYRSIAVPFIGHVYLHLCAFLVRSHLIHLLASVRRDSKAGVFNTYIRHRMKAVYFPVMLKSWM